VTIILIQRRKCIRDSYFERVGVKSKTYRIQVHFLILSKQRVMLTNDPRVLVKKTKKEKFCLKMNIFILLIV